MAYTTGAEFDELTIEIHCFKCGKDFKASKMSTTCQQCNHTGTSYDFPTAQAVRVAKQNDAFRRDMAIHGGSNIPGIVVVTQAVTARGEVARSVIEAVYWDEHFTVENDPHRDHSFGIVTIQGEQFYWKIDLYNSNLTRGSEQPDDLTQTTRVLTIMEPREY